MANRGPNDKAIEIKKNDTEEVCEFFLELLAECEREEKESISEEINDEPIKAEQAENQE